jgi:hypothetical protein
MFELDGVPADRPVRLHFGPRPPTGDQTDIEGRWIQTLPGVGWFVYFRIYGPSEPAFDHTWQLPDFTLTS